MVRGTLQLDWVCERCRAFDMALADISDVEDGTLNMDDPNVALPDNTLPINTTIADRTFDIGDRNFALPRTPLDESMSDAVLDDEVPIDTPTSYNIVENATQRGGRKLVSSNGYTYSVRKIVRGRTYWTCTVRGKNKKCYANVKQFSELFTPSLDGHNHAPSPDVLKNVIISVKVKECARTNVYRSAPEIVETVMKECISVDSFNLPKPSNLVRAANYQRHTIRPKEPVTLDYEVIQGSKQLKTL